jgi:hypothetical protein
MSCEVDQQDPGDPAAKSDQALVSMAARSILMSSAGSYCRDPRRSGCFDGSPSSTKIIRPQLDEVAMPAVKMKERRLRQLRKPKLPKI